MPDLGGQTLQDDRSDSLGVVLWGWSGARFPPQKKGRRDMRVITFAFLKAWLICT
jgi:hypothetical protein